MCIAKISVTKTKTCGRNRRDAMVCKKTKIWFLSSSVMKQNHTFRKMTKHCKVVRVSAAKISTGTEGLISFEASKKFGVLVK